jgi:hypothetical protein
MFCCFRSQATEPAFKKWEIKKSVQSGNLSTRRQDNQTSWNRDQHVGRANLFTNDLMRLFGISESLYGSNETSQSEISFSSKFAYSSDIVNFLFESSPRADHRRIVLLNSRKLSTWNIKDTRRNTIKLIPEDYLCSLDANFPLHLLSSKSRNFRFYDVV